MPLLRTRSSSNCKLLPAILTATYSSGVCSRGVEIFSLPSFCELSRGEYRPSNAITVKGGLCEASVLGVTRDPWAWSCACSTARPKRLISCWQVVDNCAKFLTRHWMPCLGVCSDEWIGVGVLHIFVIIVL